MTNVVSTRLDEKEIEELNEISEKIFYFSNW